MRKKILHSIVTSRNVIRTLLIGILILATASVALAQDLVPYIEIQPGTSVEVGEEVYLSATGTTYPDATILGKARYEWDFGDGYTFKYGSGIVGTPYYYLKCSGIAVTHYFMKPGDFTVTLTVNVWAEFDASGYPVGSPLATNTTIRVIHVAGEAPMAGFEIQRAPFHNRLAQYLYVQIPEAYRRNETTLRVYLVGAKGTSSILLSKGNLAGEERVFLDHKSLAQDDYVVIAELFNESGERISGGLWRDKFSKRYSGIPKVGIDENNAFRVNGELFFPMTPYMASVSEFSKFITQAGINTVNTAGYYSTHTPTTWSDYLINANASGLMAMGPGRGDYYINFAPSAANRWKMNHNPDRMAQYIRITKDQPAMFAWLWQDEPNMGGWGEKTYTPTLAAWAYVGHREDPHHPNYNLFVGSDWSKYYGTKPNFYDYLGSAMFFGGKKWMQDIFSFDTYPITQRLSAIENFTDMGPYAAYLDALDRTQTNNKNLVPVIPALQPCKGKTTSIVSEEQVYLETWMNVIHGAKGILWFNYFDMANTGRWAAMKKFADQIKVLAPVVLGPVPNRTITDTANMALNRVDTMIREKDGTVYVFATRVTEPDPIDGAKYTGVEPEFITVSFTISGLTGSTIATVVDEGRTHAVTDGKFTDTFAKNAVHIYKIAGVTTTTLKAPGPRNLRVKKK
ncbi:MAG: PKD domain-containing protein [Smithella sp.]